MPARKGGTGFTLVRVAAAVAIAVILAVILVPLISKNITDSQVSRARNEAKMIAGAMTAAFKDLGRWPNRQDNTSDFGGLYTGASPPSESFLRIAAGWAPAGKAWSRLDTHLIRNEHDYPDAGDKRWNGPYSSHLPVDPWGRPYVVNSLYFTLASDPPIPVWVVSAGPNGIIETNIDTHITSPGGDDVGVRIR